MSKKAKIYRMVIPGKHICPYGVKSLHLLKKHGYEVEDIHLKTKKETEQFKKENNFEDTPRIYINGEHIGNDDDLAEFLGYEVPDENKKTYRPVIAIFSVAFLLSLVINFIINWSEGWWMIFPNFIAISMILLALQKLQNTESFSIMFLGYDLLSQKWVPYSYLYPYFELIAGVLMLADILDYISIPIAMLIGLAGSISVFKAVYIDKRELKCACVGGDSNTPLGFVSLTENVMMIVISIWMIVENLIF